MSEELFDALMDFCTGLEAAVAKLKKDLYDLVQKADDVKLLWDPANVRWEKAESDKGVYEKAAAEANNGVKDFENMVADLKLHGGKMRKGGFFYWLFEFADKPTVGRKAVKRAAGK
ncbi:MAG: hypothetical protein QW160_04305 [Candidatus Bathyarchaeia archaeon]